MRKWDAYGNLVDETTIASRISMEDVLINAAAVRDTNATTYSASDYIDGHDGLTLYINSSLDQAGNLALEYSRDNGATWAQVGAAIATTANMGITFRTTDTILLARVGKIRAKYTATVAPTTGTITVTLQKASSNI